LFYGGSEEIKLNYRKLSAKIKKPGANKISIYLKSFMFLLKSIFNTEFCQKKSQQILFPTSVKGVFGFQTIAVKDWVKSLGRPLDFLLKENGISIIHSYFSFLKIKNVHGNFHPLFFNLNGDISLEVDNAFGRVGKLIQETKIWNPTLTEYYSYVKILNTVEISFENHSYLMSEMYVPYRLIQ